MSRSYYAISTEDLDAIGPIVEGGVVETPPIDSVGIRTCLQSTLEGGDVGTLKWQGDGGYVFVDVYSHHVEVTAGGDAGDEQIDVVLDVIELLTSSGLYVFDAQRGRFLK